jgi:hypothetical protein
MAVGLGHVRKGAPKDWKQQQMTYLRNLLCIRRPAHQLNINVTGRLKVETIVSETDDCRKKWLQHVYKTKTKYVNKAGHGIQSTGTKISSKIMERMRET